MLDLFSAHIIIIHSWINGKKLRHMHNAVLYSYNLKLYAGMRVCDIICMYCTCSSHCLCIYVWMYVYRNDENSCYHNCHLSHNNYTVIDLEHNVRLVINNILMHPRKLIKTLATNDDFHYNQYIRKSCTSFLCKNH